MSRVRTPALAAAGILAAALALPAVAQSPARPSEPETRAATEQRMRERLERIDTNRDGRIDAAERQAAAAARKARAGEAMFARLDRDGDGTISRAEFDAGMAQRRGGRGEARRAPGEQRTAREPLAIDHLVARRLERFDRLDRDGDGVVTREERRAARGERRGRAG